MCSASLGQQGPRDHLSQVNSDRAGNRNSWFSAHLPKWHNTARAVGQGRIIQRAVRGVWGCLGVCEQPGCAMAGKALLFMSAGSHSARRLPGAGPRGIQVLERENKAHKAAEEPGQLQRDGCLVLCAPLCHPAAPALCSQALLPISQTQNYLWPGETINSRIISNPATAWRCLLPLSAPCPPFLPQD